MDPKQAVVQRYHDVKAELHDIAHFMYEHPELAYEEFEASARLADFLAR